MCTQVYHILHEGIRSLWVQFRFLIQSAASGPLGKAYFFPSRIRLQLKRAFTLFLAAKVIKESAVLI